MQILWSVRHEDAEGKSTALYDVDRLMGATRRSNGIKRNELSPPGTLTDKNKHTHTLLNSSRKAEKTCLLERGR